jgi:hypothetical protein
MPCSTETEAATYRPDSKQLFEDREGNLVKKDQDHVKDAEDGA